MKEIEGLEGYFADEEGNIWGNRKCGRNEFGELRILKSSSNGRGYLQVCMQINKVQISKKVHRLIALTFIPNPENKPQVNHINGIKTDNRAVNLEWSTNKENNHHARKLGLQTILKGEKVACSKLTESQVLDIRGDARTKKVIAEEYNVNITTIYSIISRKTWKHI